VIVAAVDLGTNTTRLLVGEVDSGRVEDVFLRPGSAYTRELINAIPGQRSADRH